MARESFNGTSRFGAGAYVGNNPTKKSADLPFATQAQLGGPFGAGLLNLSSETKKIVGSVGDVFRGIDIHLFRIPGRLETRKKCECFVS